MTIFKKNRAHYVSRILSIRESLLYARGSFCSVVRESFFSEGTILDFDRHWNKLLFKGSIMQEKSPLNCGLKATKEFALFN